MPRETIRPEHDSMPELVVQWGAHEVQFGIETPPGHETGLRHSLVDHLYGDSDTLASIGGVVRWSILEGPIRDALRVADETEGTELVEAAFQTLGRAVLDALTGSTPAGGYTGFWTTIGRSGLNRVVKVTRRARNVVHGADE